MATPNAIQAAWKGLNSDPRFKQLPYEKQQEIRAQWAQRNLPMDPQFMQMSAPAQAKVFQEFVTQPPSFVSANEYTQLNLDIARGVRSGDPEALRQASLVVAGDRATRNTSPIYKLVTNVMGRVDEETFGGLEAPDPGTDEYKSVQYLEQVYETSDNKTFWQGVLSGIAPFIGIASNIMATRVGGQSLLQGARAAGAARAARSTSTFGKWAARSAGPEAFESGLDALSMTVTDAMSKQINDNIAFGLEPSSGFAGWAANFGTNFVGDMAFFGIGSLLLNSVRAGAKVFRPRGMAGRAAKDIPDETFEAMNRSFMTGEELDRSQMMSLPEETQRHYRELRRLFAAGEAPTPEQTARADLLAKGYDVRDLNGQTRVIGIRSGEVVQGSYTDAEGGLKALFDQEMNPTRPTQLFEAEVNNEFAVQKMATAEFGDQLPELSQKTLARTLVPDANGRLNPDTIRVATRSAVQQAGGNADVVRKVDVQSVNNDAYWKMSDEARAQGSRIYVPETVKSSDEMTRFLNRYTTDVAKLAPEGGDALRHYITDVGQQANEIRVATNPAYVEALAVSNGIPFQRMANGSYQIGDQMVPNLKEAADAMTKRIMLSTDTDIVKTFGEQFDIRIEYDEAGQVWNARYKQADRGGNLISGNHATPEGVRDELMNKGFRPRVSQKHALDVVINEAGTGLEIAEGVARGPREAVIDYMKRFYKETDAVDILETYGTATIAKGSIKDIYRVTSPEVGVSYQARSFKEAQKFLKWTGDTMESVRDLAFQKGVVSINPVAGRLAVQEFGQKGTKMFNSLEELSDYIKAKTPDPEWTKEISNIDQSMIDDVWNDMPEDLRQLYAAKSGGIPKPKHLGDLLEHMRQNPSWSNPTPTGEYGTGAAYKGSMRNVVQTLKDMFQTPMYARTRRIAGQLGGEGGGRHLVDTFEDIEKQMKNARGINVQADELVHSITAFDGAPNVKRRAQLRDLLDVPDNEWAAKAEALKIKNFGDNDVRFLQRFRQVSNTLGESFGIDPYKLISGWLPRFKGWLDSAAGRAARASSTEAEDLINKSNSHMPNEVKFFSEYMRASDLVTWAAETDPMDLLAKYAKKGIKNMTLGRAYNKVKNEWGKLMAGGEINQQVSYTMMHYLEAVMGMYSDEATKMMAHSANEIGAIFAGKINAGKNTGAVKDMVSKMHGFTIAALMSFRPWPVVRNMQQVWTTLAPMFSNEEVGRALGKIARSDDWLAARYDKLAKSGRLQDRIPIYGLNYEGQGLTGLFNKFGMKFYKNSDDYTRIVVDEVVRDRFTDAVAKLRAGTFKNNDQFIRAANLHRLDDFDQQRIVELLDTKGFDSAMDYYGDIVTRETMFAYSAGSNPAAFNGMWGRLFGMFGHYSVYYMQTLLNGVRRGSLLDKAKFAGRVAFNSAALWFAFEKVFGIRADDFKPHKTAFFSGGPYFHLLSDAMGAAAGDPGTSWKTVRQDVGRLFIPGSLQASSMYEGIQWMEQGRTYDGFLRLMSAPTLDD